jgi:hypothetical protein
MIDPALKSSHAWATAALRTAPPHSLRADILEAEKQRLSGLLWREKDKENGVVRREPSGTLPYPERRALYLAAKAKGAGA